MYHFEETIQICLEKLYSLPDPPTLPRAALHKLLEFATKKSHFLFDDQYYDQIDRVAMGSPLGPVLANIWVTKGQIRPSLWCRYVDDTFTMFENKDTANEFLRYLNSRCESIKFAIDFEQDNEIPFEDISSNAAQTTLGRSIVVLDAHWGRSQPQRVAYH